MTKPPRPTEGELDILRQLWSHGPCTVREVHERLAAGTGYTTTLKMLQLMLAKGLVTRADERQPHHYAAAVAEQACQRRLLGELLDKAFAGSTSRLVMQALDLDRVSDAELAEIRRLVAQRKKGRS